MDVDIFAQFVFLRYLRKYLQLENHFYHTGISEFSLIPDFFTSNYLEIIFEISSLEHVSGNSIIDSDFQMSFCIISDFSLNLIFIPEMHKTKSQYPFKCEFKSKRNCPLLLIRENLHTRKYLRLQYD